MLEEGRTFRTALQYRLKVLPQVVFGQANEFGLVRCQVLRIWRLPHSLRTLRSMGILHRTVQLVDILYSPIQ